MIRGQPQHGGKGRRQHIAAQAQAGARGQSTPRQRPRAVHAGNAGDPDPDRHHGSRLARGKHHVDQMREHERRRQRQRRHDDRGDQRRHDEVTLRPPEREYGRQQAAESGSRSSAEPSVQPTNLGLAVAGGHGASSRSAMASAIGAPVASSIQYHWPFGLSSRKT